MFYAAVAHASEREAFSPAARPANNRPRRSKKGKLGQAGPARFVRAATIVLSGGATQIRRGVAVVPGPGVPSRGHRRSAVDASLKSGAANIDASEAAGITARCACRSACFVPSFNFTAGTSERLQALAAPISPRAAPESPAAASSWQPALGDEPLRVHAPAAHSGPQRGAAIIPISVTTLNTVRCKFFPSIVARCKVPAALSGVNPLGLTLFFPVGGVPVLGPPCAHLARERAVNKSKVARGQNNP